MGTARAAPVASAAPAPVTIPDQDTPVVDAAHVLDADSQRQLVDLLHSLKEKTGDQIKVLTVPSLAGEDIFSFAQRHYVLWKLGSKKESKGALIVLAPADHKVRIQTGYGLEGALPDSWCGTAERSVAQKYFASRQYAQGLVALTQAVVRRAAADAGVELAGLPAERRRRSSGFDPTLLIISALVLFYLFNLYRQWKNRGSTNRWSRASPGWGWSTFPSGGRSGGGGDWSGGGGSWSSGGSDFGGGGSSGGGGASASW